MLIVATLFLVACGGNNEDMNTIELSSNNDTEVNDNTSTHVIAEINQTIESDLVEVDLINVEYVPEDEVGNYPYYKINFTAINKSDDDIWLSTDKESIDNVMASDLFTAADDITPGKTMNDYFQIINYDEELPEIKESIEFNLDVVSDMERQETHEVKIKIN